MPANLNPQLNPGSLNKLAASVSIPSFPQLNVLAPFLAKQAIRLTPEGDVTKFLEVLTAAVQSPEPYQMFTMTIHLVKTLPLCALWQNQILQNSNIGNLTVRPDVSRGSGGLQPFDVVNAGILSAREMDFSGEDAAFGVAVRGYLYVNAQMWSGVANIAIPG